MALKRAGFVILAINIGDPSEVMRGILIEVRRELMREQNGKARLGECRNQSTPFGRGLLRGPRSRRSTPVAAKEEVDGRGGDDESEKSQFIRSRAYI